MWLVFGVESAAQLDLMLDKTRKQYLIRKMMCLLHEQLYFSSHGVLVMDYAFNQ